MCYLQMCAVVNLRYVFIPKRSYCMSMHTDDEGFDSLRGVLGRRRFRGRTTTTPAPAEQPQCVTCAAEPCYPGVVCTPTPTGYQCGACPQGMTGNGIECIPLITCADDPCFPGVLCTDTSEYIIMCERVCLHI
mgnify:FL=1